MKWQGMTSCSNQEKILVNKVQYSKRVQNIFGEDVSKRITSVKLTSYSSKPHYYKSKNKPNTPYNSHSPTPYNSIWRASHQNKAAPKGRSTGANTTRTKD